MSVLINASTTSGLVQTADTSGTLELQSNGTTQLTVSSTGAYGQLKSGIAQASTSGTFIDFTGLPSWVKRITVIFNGVSTNGTSNLLLQIGDGSVNTTGYLSGLGFAGGSSSAVGPTTVGFVCGGSVAANLHYGNITLTLIGSNTWVYSFSGYLNSGGVPFGICAGGSKTLTGALDRVRITTVGGTDTFDAGSINILYEG